MSEVETKRQHARESLQAADILIDAGLYRDSVSRSYYAMFSAAQALLIAHNLTPRTHKGTHVLLDKHFVKTGRLPTRVSRTLRQAFDARQLADYSDESPSQSHAEELFVAAEDFVAQVAHHLTMEQ